MNVEEEVKDGVNPTVIAITTTNQRLSEFQWGKKQVMALISKVEEFFEDFYDDSKKKKAIWNAVAKRMQEDGYTVTGSDCDKKWRNLKGTYVKVLQKQLSGETGYRFEYFDALHHILGKEIDPIDGRDDPMTQDEPASPPSFDSPSSPIPDEYQEIAVDGDFEWNDDAVVRLLGLLRHHRNVLGHSNDTCHPSWQAVALDMNEGGYDIDGEQCQRKWISLLFGYRFHKAEAQTTGCVPMWQFFTRVRDLVNITSSRSSVQNSTSTREKKKRGRGRGRPMHFKPSRQKEKGLLERVRQIEEEIAIGQRLNRLETRVEINEFQKDMYADTNAVLTQMLSELKTLNTVLETQASEKENSEEQQDTHQTEHVENQDDSSCGSNQGIIIVEAFNPDNVP